MLDSLLTPFNLPVLAGLLAVGLIFLWQRVSSWSSPSMTRVEWRPKESACFKCVVCGDANLIPGLFHYGYWFQPDVRSWKSFAPWRAVRAVACNKCGFVALYLAEEKKDESKSAKAEKEEGTKRTGIILDDRPREP